LVGRLVFWSLSVSLLIGLLVGRIFRYLLGSVFKELTQVWDLNGCSFDFSKKHVHHEMTLQRLEILGRYNVSGRLLLLPISGNGDINITLGKCL
jgi:hypothetical protein